MTSFLSQTAQHYPGAVFFLWSIVLVPLLVALLVFVFARSSPNYSFIPVLAFVGFSALGFLILFFFYSWNYVSWQAPSSLLVERRWHFSELKCQQPRPNQCRCLVAGRNTDGEQEQWEISESDWNKLKLGDTLVKPDKSYDLQIVSVESR